MTPIEHYAEADNLLKNYAENQDRDERWQASRMELLAEAQVHATLATLCARTAD